MCSALKPTTQFVLCIPDLVQRVDRSKLPWSSIRLTDVESLAIAWLILIGLLEMSPMLVVPIGNYPRHVEVALTPCAACTANATFKVPCNDCATLCSRSRTQQVSLSKCLTIWLSRKSSGPLPQTNKHSTVHVLDQHTGRRSITAP